MGEKIIFHIDVNSAYLSWTAVSLLQLGETALDIRKVPSVIGGNSDERHGIILAKSIPAKKFKIQTGEPVGAALNKCPNLIVYPPNYKLFMRSSNAMYDLLCEYSPLIQRYSIDEVFMDASHFKDNYMQKAIEIKDRILKELGFAVNIGISTNKLLAKMASDFEPKDSIHTLFHEEVSKKMWPLPVGDLFMVGKATRSKLFNLNINTIGDLAKYDLNTLKPIFKSYANVIHNYANGIDTSEVRSRNYLQVKGLGNSITLKRDIETRTEALQVLLSLIETTSMRLRENESLCGVIAISLKTNSFIRYSHQKTLDNNTDSTHEIFNEITHLFDEAWRNEPLRQLGVRLTNLCSNEFYQKSFFDDKNIEKKRALDKTIDDIRKRFGNTSIIRSTFIDSDIKPLNGGVGEDDYLMMGSTL